MAFFSKILEKLGFGSSTTAASSSAPQSTGASEGSGAAPATPPPQAIAVVDVVAQLEQRAAANPQKLNWRTSIVDLLKLLDIDSSFDVAQGAGHRAGLPGGSDGRFGQDERMAAQDRACAHRRQRRQRSQGSARLSSRRKHQPKE